MGLALAALVITVLPTAAQDGEPTLEGTAWSLVSHAHAGGTAPVPLGVEADLLLEDGTASGSSGCNAFSGTYDLDGDRLSFDEAFTTTLRACEGEGEAVESAYYAALPQVAAWTSNGTTLELLDEFDETLLTFDSSPPSGASAAQVARLLDRIVVLEDRLARAEERIDNIAISRLRERIRSLETDNESLKSQVARLRAGPVTPTAPPGGGIEFNRAEETLLTAVPPRFHARCQPLRSSLPDATIAGVSCRPNTTRVASMVYYLMEGDFAVGRYTDIMDAQGVPRYGDIVPLDTDLCAEGVPSSISAGGGYIGLEGCFRDGRARLHVVEQVTDCRQLDVGPTRLLRPAMYVELQGPDSDIATLHAWANRNPATNLSPLIVPLGDTGGAPTPDCFTA